MKRTKAAQAQQNLESAGAETTTERKQAEERKDDRSLAPKGADSSPRAAYLARLELMRVLAREIARRDHAAAMREACQNTLAHTEERS